LPLSNRVTSIIRLVFQSKKFTIGFIIICILAFITIFAEQIAPGDVRASGQFPRNLPPSRQHLLGTDSLGRDCWLHLVHATRNSLIIGILAGGIGLVLGALFGFVSGMSGGRIDSLIRSIIDVFLVLPAWPLLVLVASYVRFVTILMMATLLSVLSWAWPARTIRSQVLSLKERGFVDLSRISGANSLQIIFIELMPNMLPYLGASFANAVSGAMLAEVGLELIGLGPQGTTTLGLILYWAQLRGALMLNLWWWLFPPIGVLVLIFIGFHLINMGFEEIYNPRLRRR